jgi:predicted nucleic acid-binding Zn ribbon protein
VSGDAAGRPNDKKTPAGPAAGRPAELAALDRIRASGPRARRRRARGEGASGRDPILLGEAVDALIERAGAGRDLAATELIVRWADIVGPEVAQHAKATELRDGTLTVSADSAPWATQLRLLPPQLLARLAREVGADIVLEVRVPGPSGRSGRGRQRPR